LPQIEHSRGFSFVCVRSCIAVGVNALIPKDHFRFTHCMHFVAEMLCRNVCTSMASRQYEEVDAVSLTVEQKTFDHIHHIWNI